MAALMYKMKTINSGVLQRQTPINIMWVVEEILVIAQMIAKNLMEYLKVLVQRKNTKMKISVKERR